MPTATSHETIEYLPDVEPETAARVLAALNRSQRRTDGHFTDYRRTQRFVYAAAIVVRTIVPLRRRAEDDDYREASFPAYARNLSQGGIGFVLAPRYVPRRAADKGVILRGEEIVAVKKPLEIGLPNPAGEMRWFAGRVVRRRMIQFGFVDCGLAFEV